MKYAHVRTEAVAKWDGVDEGDFILGDWMGGGGGSGRVLAEPSAYNCMYGSRVPGVGGGVASHSMRVYSRFLSQHLNYYFRKRAICASRFLRIRVLCCCFLFLLFGMFFGNAAAFAGACLLRICI